MVWQRIRGVMNKVHALYGRNLLIANTASAGGNQTLTFGCMGVYLFTLTNGGRGISYHN